MMKTIPPWLSAKRQGLRRFWPLLILFIFVPVLSSCTHFFYQPDRFRYFDPASAGVEYRDVYFKGAHGATLHGWFFPAKNGTPERGSFIQFHGNAENISTHFNSLFWVTGRGYNLFTFDYSGYGDSEGEAGPKELYEDALAALKEGIMIEKERAAATGRATRVAAYGQSLGGAVLLRALADFPERNELAVVVADSAFASYQSEASDVMANSWITWLFQPLPYFLVSDAYAPESTMAALKGIPLIVIHGTADRVVPIRHGRRIYQLAAGPKEFWEVPGGRHIDSMTRKDGEFRERLIRYLEGVP